MSLVLNERQKCDLEMLLNRGFAPLNGFMKEADYISVMEKGQLMDETIWPIPIVLPTLQKFQKGDLIFLQDENKNNLASMLIEEIYRPHFQKEFLSILGTEDDNHPYIKYINSLGPLNQISYLGGKIEKLDGVKHYNFLDLRLTPENMKEEISNYDRILGFQTRNPMHNSHFFVALNAYQNIPETNKLLLLMPVVGVTQDDDVNYTARVRCYKHILKKFHQYNVNVKLVLIPLSMRMAGPKEAILHAIIRKNYGCTDFVIGRDHAGPSIKKKNGESFYGLYEAQELAKKYESKLGINILFSANMVYDSLLNKYVEEHLCNPGFEKNISGTKLRSMLKHGEKIPDWFTLPEVAQELEAFYKKGICYYLVGLSGSGKTTLARALKEKLAENYPHIILLDGDEIRDKLSGELTFSRKDRSTNTRRIGYIASLLVKAGNMVICSNIAPYEEDRQYNRTEISQWGKYVEIYVNTSLEICEKRDVKGLYKKVRNGQLKNFTGIDDPFEAPSNAEIILTGEGDINVLLEKILTFQ